MGIPEVERQLNAREVEAWAMASQLLRDWYGKLRARHTRFKYGKGLYRFHVLTGHSPEKLIEFAREGKRLGEPVAERMLESALSKARSAGVSKWMIRDMGLSVKSFYREHFYGISPRAGKIEIAKVKPYRCPTQDEIREFTKGANLRDVSLIEFLASVPVREETLTKIKLSYLWDELIESSREDGTVHVSIMGHEMKGGGVGKFQGLEQHAFLYREPLETLRKYLKTRTSLSPEDPLFASVEGEETHLVPSSIRSIFLAASERSGMTISCHDLRRFVQTQLEAARVQPNWIRKLMGKTIKGEENPYSQPKLEQLRESFKSAIPYLTLIPKTDETRLWKAQARQSLEMLSKLGVLPESEFARLTERLMRSKESEEFYSELRPLTKLEAARVPEDERLRKLTNGESNQHRIVEGEGEMLKLLDQGWTLERELNGGQRFLMKRD